MRKDQFGHEANDIYTFVPIKVAGVTHKNGRRSRQTILRRIYWKDEPYQKIDGIDLVPTLFENEPAVEIWVFNKKSREMIGYVPKSEASFVYSNILNYDGYFDFDVYGGGRTPDGETISFGASIKLRFKNTDDTILTPDVPTRSELEINRAIEAANRALNWKPSYASPKAPPKQKNKTSPILYITIAIYVLFVILYLKSKL